eukprot:m.44208 g.44208  ORF g.44208 m.44208 type:complete len:321 (+) comp33508_c0_seq3:49-1011(+)
MSDDEAAMNIMILEMVDEIALGVCFEAHRAAKRDTFTWTSDEEDLSHEPVVELGCDVFGRPPLKKAVECKCPNCDRLLVVSRFAPHLEKCMGMGRNSTRSASRRIAYVPKEGISDEDEGDDWLARQSRDQRRMKREAVCYLSSANILTCCFAQAQSLYPGDSLPRAKKMMVDLRASPASSSAGTGSPNCSANIVGADGKRLSSWALAFLEWPLEKRKSYLMITCGVISEHSGKMCTRSHRCPQHNTEQRQNVWELLVGEPSTGVYSPAVIDVVDPVDTVSLTDSEVGRSPASSHPSSVSSTPQKKTAKTKQSNRRKNRKR